MRVIWFPFCESKSLTTVPTFRNTSYKMTQPWTIDLQDNSISSIPDHAFSNLQEYANGINVTIKLERNYLRHISDSAFSGIESLVIFVDLRENRLQVLPPFVSKLPNLKYLSVLENPIAQVDPSVLTTVHETLKTSKISLRDLPMWPKSMYSLSNLETLEVETNSHVIPANAFTGLNNTLRYLTIINAHLFNITAVCGLSVLETLNIEYSSDITGDNVLNCALPMNSTKYIQFEKLASNRFINVLGIFPNVEQLQYVRSGLSFIDESLIPTGNRIEYFSCQYCNLKLIPGAINLFRQIMFLNLIGNNITTVERYSLDNLQYLLQIALARNPIVYISRFAFRNLVNLNTLILSDTKLTTIPHVVTTLPNFQYLHMGSNITCACGPLWMKQWAISMSDKAHFYIVGGCHASNETLKRFVLHTLPNCP